MDGDSWADTQRAFADAAQWFVEVARTGVGRWDEEGLGEWSVRDLVGHTSRALLTVENYLDAPLAPLTLSSPTDYFRAALATIGDAAEVAQRGRDAGARLGDDIPGAVTLIADRVLARIQSASADAVVATPVGSMLLRDYLPTRTVELTVHTCDLAVAIDRPLEVPATAAAQSLAVLGDVAAQGDSAGQLLLAATGRQGLPPGFTVL